LRFVENVKTPQTGLNTETSFIWSYDAVIMNLQRRKSKSVGLLFQNGYKMAKGRDGPDGRFLQSKHNFSLFVAEKFVLALVV